MILQASGESTVLEIGDRAGVGEARRVVTRMAMDMGFGETERGRLAIIASEAATNLAVHARDGKLLVQGFRIDGRGWMEVLAIDSGPGISDVSRSLRDGYSTAGTAGQGLGAISRLADVFEIHSRPGAGTVLLARVCAAAAERHVRPAPVRFGAISVPKPGETFCGDSWAVAVGAERSMVMVVDGLGHGPQASDAALEARRTFTQNSEKGAQEVLQLAHAALRKTRGAAMALTELDHGRSIARFAGVGNIAASVVSGEGVRNMVSYNGIVGHEIRKLQEFSYPLPKGALLMMHSDGITSRSRLEGYPGVLRLHPSLLAAMVYRDCARGRDDATVVILGEIAATANGIASQS